MITGNPKSGYFWAGLFALWILVFPFAAQAGSQFSEVQIGQVRYSGGNWNPRPNAVQVLSQEVTFRTSVEVGKIDGHQKRIPAKIVPFPFYDPEKKKVRS